MIQKINFKVKNNLNNKIVCKLNFKLSKISKVCKQILYKMIKVK